MLNAISKALRCFGVDVQKRMAQHSADEWLRREDLAKRKRAVEEAKAKPYAENYRYLVALKDGYVMVASKSEALILQDLVALEVPVEYEPEIVIEGRTYKGDFRVRNQEQRREGVLLGASGDAKGPPLSREVEGEGGRVPACRDRGREESAGDAGRGGRRGRHGANPQHDPTIPRTVNSKEGRTITSHTKGASLHFLSSADKPFFYKACNFTNPHI